MATAPRLTAEDFSIEWMNQPGELMLTIDITMAIPPRTYGAMQMRLRESLITRALVLPIQEFIHIQGISSVVLLGAAIVALIWANSPWHDSYHHVWETGTDPLQSSSFPCTSGSTTR